MQDVDISMLVTTLLSSTASFHITESFECWTVRGEGREGTPHTHTHTEREREREGRTEGGCQRDGLRRGGTTHHTLHTQQRGSASLQFLFSKNSERERERRVRGEEES